MAERLGVIFVELDIDKDRWTRANRTVLEDATRTSLNVEDNWRKLGQKSDIIYKAMADGAINQFNRIANHSKSSTDEIFRAQSAMVSKINALNAEMTRNPLYETLGIRSKAAIEAQRSAIISSYETIKASGTATAQDLVNIERAKNSKLKELNNEMVGEHEMSMASMTRAVLRFYAAFYVASMALSGVKNLLMGGVNAIDEMKVSTVAVAAQITSMQGTTGNVTENYKNNLKYAQSLVPVLEQIDANSFANLQQIQLMNRAMNLQGVILDTNNQKQIESFTALTNAVAMFTTGQDKEKQASQEVRSLMSGQVKEGNMLARIMDEQIRRQGDYANGLKGLLAEGKKHGDTLERMKEYLIGIVAASGDISKTWMAVGSSIETAWNILQRDIFKDFYKSLVIGGQEAVGWVKEHSSQISSFVRSTYDTITYAIEGTIALLSLFAAASVAKMAIAGGAATGFAAIWELMATRITLATSSMLLAWSSFVAGVVGYGFGKYLSNEFEIVRRAGIEMVYGIADVWSWLVQKFEKGTALLKFTMTSMGDPANTEKYWQDYKKNVSAIEAIYKKEKDARSQWKQDQIFENKDIIKAERELAAELERISDFSVPKIKGGVGEVDDKAAKDREKALDEKYALERKLAQANFDAEEKMRKDAEAGAKQSIATAEKLIKEKYDYELKIAKATADAEAKMMKDAEDGYKRTMSSIQNILSYNISFYDSIEGYEDKTLELKKEALALELSFIEDREAAEKLFYQRVGEWEQERFEKKTKYISDGFGDLSSAFDGISKLYAEGSADANRWAEASKAMEIAQRAVAVVNAVATIANQGLGDPYTAFARIAAMAAAMGALLATIGEGINTGSASSSASTSASSSASTTASASIQNSVEILRDTYSMEYEQLSDLNSAMKDLNQNITGLVSNVVRYGTSTGSWDTGTLAETQGASKYWDKYGKVVIGSGTADPFRLMSQWDSQASNILNVDLFGKLADMIVSKALDYLWGGSSTTSVSRAGIEAGGATVGGLTSGQGFDVLHAFQELKTETEGGLFGSDKTSYSVGYSQMSEEINRLFTSSFVAMSESAIYLAKSFGTDLNAALSYGFDAIVIELQGKTTDEINSAITEAISAQADTMAETLFGSIIEQYQQIDEGLYETAVRLATDKAIVLESLEMVNQGFSGTAVEAIALSENMIKLAGDLDTLTGYVSKYFDSFFSEAEQMAYIQDNLSGTMADLNKTLPETRDGYRAIVESLDLTTAAGQSAYVTLMALSESADAYYSHVEDLAKTSFGMQLEILELEGKTAEATAISRYAELLAMDESLRPMQLRIWALQDDAATTERNNTRRSMEIKFVELTGNKIEALAASREMEINALDESLRPLQRLIYAIGDYQDAVAQLTAAQENAAASALTIATNSSQYDVQILSLQGRTAESIALQREIELAAIDKSLWPRQQLVWTLEDQAEADASVQAATEALAAAMDALDTAQQAATRSAMEKAAEDAKAALDIADQNLSQAETDLKNAFDARKNELTEQYNEQLDALNDRLDSATEIISDLKGNVDKLNDALRSMTIESDKYIQAQFIAAQKLLYSTLASAKAGDLSGLSAVTDVLDTLTSNNMSNFFGVATDYYREYFKIQNALSELSGISGVELTNAESDAASIESEIEVLKVNHEEDLAALDSQLDALLGINNSILSIDAAMSQYQSAISQQANASAAYDAATAALSASEITSTTDLSVYAGAIVTAQNVLAEALANQERVNLAVVSALEAVAAADALYGTPGSAISTEDQLNIAGLQAVVDQLTATLSDAVINNFGAQANLISSLYQSILGREADTGGLAFYTAKLVGGTSAQQIAAELFNSSEYLNRSVTESNLVSGLFQSILGRSASAADLDFYMNKISSGYSANQIAAEIFNSQEYEGIKSLRGFASGGYPSDLAVVGEDGPEVYDFRSGRVYSNSESKGLVSNTAVVSELKELRNAVNEQKGINYAMLTKLSRIERYTEYLETWDQNDAMPGA